MLAAGTRKSALGAFCVLALHLAGCGPAEEVFVPVEGQVWHDDKPLTSGSVLLRADTSKSNYSKHEPRGQIDADGKFRIFTALRPGAPPGWYRVAVLVTGPSDSRSYKVPKSLLPARYADPDRSGLTFEAKTESPPGSYDLKLQSRR